jgi:hypothetical protein
MTGEKEKNYYIKKKRMLMRQFDAALTIGKKVLIDYFGEDKFNELSTKTREDFEQLLPQIPYVGGKDNILTDALVSAVILLPLIRIFEKEGLDFNEIGKLTYDLYEAFYTFIPPTVDMFSEETINQMKESAKISKLRKYPNDWVFDFVEGDGETFTWGIDFSECAVYKFYKSQGMEHLMPIMCIADFEDARVHGYGLTRTQNIGNGAPICDFRYNKDGTTLKAWPPDNLPEFKNK